MFRPYMLAFFRLRFNLQSSYTRCVGRSFNFLDATYYVIVLLRGCTCFGHYYAHHQELATIITKNIVYYTYSQTQLYFTY